MLHHGEYRRLLTGVMLHADMTHLVSNCTSVVLEGLPLERRLGSPAFLALVASTSLTSQGLYREQAGHNSFCCPAEPAACLLLPWRAVFMLWRAGPAPLHMPGQRPASASDPIMTCGLLSSGP